MKRFLVGHYDATGYASPGSTVAFNSIELAYKITSKHIRTHWEDNLSETISTYYSTPASSLCISEGDIIIPTYGTYTFKVVGTSGVCDLFINGEFVAGTYVTSGEAQVYLPSGVASLKLRFVGSSSGGYTLTWKQPGASTFVSIPNQYRPFYGYTLFPFTVYDQVTEDLKKDYTIIGNSNQKQQIVSNSEPYKTFQVTLKQDNVQERVYLKNWFASVQGKVKPFMFNSRKAEFTVVQPLSAGSTSILVKKSYSTIAYSYVKKVLYFPSIQFATQVVSVGEVQDPELGACDELFLADPIAADAGSCGDINFLYFCRLNTDTLTFELEDINFSSVRLPIYELYNDNYTTYLQ